MGVVVASPVLLLLWVRTLNRKLGAETLEVVQWK